jgi:hypothetical protein
VLAGSIGAISGGEQGWASGTSREKCSFPIGTGTQRL